MSDQQPPVGICTSPHNGELLAQVYDYLELSLSSELSPLEDDSSFGPRLEALKRLSLPIRACNNFVAREVKLTGPDVDWETVQRYVKNAFERARALGVEVIVFGSGGARNVPDGYSRGLAWGQLVRFLNLCADHAAPDIHIAIEHLNRGECNIVNSFQEALALARDVDREPIRVLADIYHFVREDEPLAHIREAGDWVIHAHLADSGRRFPGSGIYPLDEMFDILKDIGYEGRLSVECRWGDDFLGEATHAADFIRGLWKRSSAP